MSESLFILRQIETRYVARPDLGELPPELLKAVATPQGAAEVAIRFLRGQEVEQLIVILLTTALKVVAVSVISRGTADQTPANPRDVYREAVRHNATGIIVAHNHPGGSNCKPSDADKVATKHLKAAGDILGINLFDHLIVSDKRVFSFRQEGLL